MIYLDYNATTPVGAEAAAAMAPYLAPGLGGAFGNPSSAHATAAAPRAGLAAARAQVARALGAAPAELTFCSGGSESISTVLKGLALAHHRRTGAPAHVVTTAVEHVAVTAALQWLEAGGFATVTVVRVSAAGVVDPEDVAAAVQPATALVSVMLANNETGALQPVAAVAAAVRRRAAELGCAPPAVHTDASQAVGKVPVDVAALGGVDFLSLAGHKLYAPKGVGATYARAGSGFALPPLVHGAAQEAGARAGTENVAFAAALGAACDAATAALAAGGARAQAALRDRLARRLQQLCAPVVVHGPLGEWLEAQAQAQAQAQCDEAPAWCQGALPNTLYVAFPGAFAAHLQAALGGSLACSAGAACHSIPATAAAAELPHGGGGGDAGAGGDWAALVASARPSHVLTAMGVPAELAVCSLRLSVGASTTPQEVDEAAELVAAAVTAARARRAAAAAAAGVGPAAASPVAPPPTTSRGCSSSSSSSDNNGVGRGLHTLSPQLYTEPLHLTDTHRFQCDATVTGVAVVAPALAAGAGGGGSGAGAAATAAATMQLLGVAPADAAVVGAPVAPHRHALVLSASVAHPQGGGQPADRGVITFAAAPRVRFEFYMVKPGSGPAGGAILHYGRFVAVAEEGDGEAAGEGDADAAARRHADALPAEAPPPPHDDAPPAAPLLGTAARVYISAPHRLLAARLHSAGHVLDQAVKAVYAALAAQGVAALPPLVPGKGYHFADGPYVEYAGAVPPEWRDRLVPLLNEAIAALIAADAPTVVTLVAKHDPAQLAAAGVCAADCAHLPDDRPVRVVAVGGAGSACPCGGTHVATAGELRGVTVRSLKVAKGKTAVKYSLLTTVQARAS